MKYSVAILTSKFHKEKLPSDKWNKRESIKKISSILIIKFVSDFISNQYSKANLLVRGTLQTQEVE